MDNVEKEADATAEAISYGGKESTSSEKGQELDLSLPMPSEIPMLTKKLVGEFDNVDDKENAGGKGKKWVWEELDGVEAEVGRSGDWDSLSMATSDVSRLSYSTDIQSMHDVILSKARAMQLELQQRASEVRGWAPFQMAPVPPHVAGFRRDGTDRLWPDDERLCV